MTAIAVEGAGLSILQGSAETALAEVETGSVGCIVEARALGRRALGVELSPDSIRLARERLLAP